MKIAAVSLSRRQKALNETHAVPLKANLGDDPQVKCCMKKAFGAGDGCEAVLIDLYQSWICDPEDAASAAVNR